MVLADSDGILVSRRTQDASEFTKMSRTGLSPFFDGAFPDHFCYLDLFLTVLVLQPQQALSLVWASRFARRYQGIDFFFLFLQVMMFRSLRKNSPNELCIPLLIGNTL